jgi:hypothetical protein
MNKKLIINFVLVLATVTGWAQERDEGQVNPTTALLGSWSGKEWLHGYSCNHVTFST